MIDTTAIARAAMGPWKEPMTYQGNVVDVVATQQDAQVLSGDQTSLVGRITTVEVLDVDVPGIKRGSSVTFRASAWTVRDFARSGLSNTMVTLFLEGA